MLSRFLVYMFIIFASFWTAFLTNRWWIALPFFGFYLIIKAGDWLYINDYTQFL